METNDRKMFAPMFRAEAQSFETQICAVLGRFEAGATPARLVDELSRLGLVIGIRASITQRISDVLQDKERSAQVERLPDGRYRVVKART
jgi:hypothetical protein